MNESHTSDDLVSYRRAQLLRQVQANFFCFRRAVPGRAQMPFSLESNAGAASGRAGVVTQCGGLFTIRQAGL